MIIKLECSLSVANRRVNIYSFFGSWAAFLSRWWKLKFTVSQIPQCNRNFITHNGIPYSKHRFYVLAAPRLNKWAGQYNILCAFNSIFILLFGFHKKKCGNIKVFLSAMGVFRQTALEIIFMAGVCECAYTHGASADNITPHWRSTSAMCVFPF